MVPDSILDAFKCIISFSPPDNPTRDYQVLTEEGESQRS